MKDFKLMATILAILATYIAFYFFCYLVAEFCIKNFM